MNIKLYNAAATQLQAKAMESLAIIDGLLNSSTMVADPFDYGGRDYQTRPPINRA